MLTSLRIDDGLYRDAKAGAAKEGVTMTQFLNQAIQLRLHPAKVGKAKKKTIDLPVYQMPPGSVWLPLSIQEMKQKDSEMMDGWAFGKLQMDAAGARGG